MKNRQKTLMVTSLIIVALVLGACGPAVTPAPAQPTTAPAAVATSMPAPTTAPVAVATTAPAAPTTAPVAVATSPAAAKKAGDCGTLRILYWQAVTILNSNLAQGTKDYDGSRLVIEPLAAMGNDGVPIAVLAAEVPTVANGGVAKDLTTTTWKLKQGVKWSDGTDFTADDVIFTYQYIADKDTAATTASAMANVKTMEAPDKYTVKITWKEPNPNFYEAFVTGTGGNILQKKQFGAFLGAKAKDGPNLATLGTGPFKIKEAKPNDVVTYDMNPLYRDFDKGKPCFKEVIFKGGGDAASAAKAVFQTGDMDYSWNLQVEASVLLPMVSEASSKGNLLIVSGSGLERLLINRTNPDPALGDKRSEPGNPHPFLSDLKVRQALALAIDNAEMAKQLYGPAGTGTCNAVTAPPAVASKNTTCKADLAAANKLLDDAGWAKGADGVRQKTVDGKVVKMNIIYQTAVNALRQKEQAFVKDAWEKLGIKVELKSVQAGVFFSSDEANPDTAAKFFTDVEMFTNGSSSPDQQQYLQGWTCSEVKTRAQKWSGSNYERACNKEYDDLFDQLRKETDPAKRNELVIKLNDFLIKDVVIIPLVARAANTSGYSKLLKGVTGSAWDSEMWNIADWTK